MIADFPVFMRVFSVFVSLKSCTLLLFIRLKNSILDCDATQDATRILQKNI